MTDQRPLSEIVAGVSDASFDARYERHREAAAEKVGAIGWAIEHGAKYAQIEMLSEIHTMLAHLCRRIP